MKRLLRGSGHNRLGILVTCAIFSLGLGVGSAGAMEISAYLTTLQVWRQTSTVVAGRPIYASTGNPTVAAWLATPGLTADQQLQIMNAALAVPGINAQGIFAAMIANKSPLATVMNVAVAANQLNAATQAAINAGISNTTVANAAVAAGATQASVSSALAAAGAPLPPAFTFAAPPGPPSAPTTVGGPTGTGGTGTGGGGGGGGVASPSS